MKTSLHSIRNSYFQLLIGYALAFTSFGSLFYSSQGMTSSFQCKDLFYDTAVSRRTIPIVPAPNKITAIELLDYVSKSISKTDEFSFIRAEAKKLGVRVWMFGGTASSYLHYVKWDLARQKGILNLQADRFDYDFTNIFRSTQDLDIVVDGSMERIQSLQNSLSDKFPYFVGSKKAWEVRSLKSPIGKPGDGHYKEALLDDPNFSNQNTDTNSLAMVEISESKEPVVRDLRTWTTGKNQFLEDVLNSTISYLRNPLHFTTARAQMGQNPEILSVMRLLVKAFQYDLLIDPKSMADMKEIIEKLDPRSVTNPSALRRMNEIGSKLVMHSSNIERAMNTLDELGLRQKLLSMNLKDQNNDTSFWLNKEPLRSFEIPRDGKVTGLPRYTSGSLKTAQFKPTGKTARDLNIQIVAHETNSFLAYESITKSHTGEPNVLISRDNYPGEAAGYGDGFYTAIGRQGAKGTGLTIRFNVDPQAREGVDFIVHRNHVIFFNKKALSVIPESLNLGVVELVDMVEKGKINLDSSDKGIIEKLKRRLNANRIKGELEILMQSKNPEDQAKFENTLISMVTNQKVKDLVAKATLSQIIKEFYKKIVSLKDSNLEMDVLKYMRVVSASLPELIKDQVLTKDEFKNYLSNKKWGGLSPEIKSTATIELALVEGVDNFLLHLNLNDIDLRSKDMILKKVKLFSESHDHRKQIVAKKLIEEKENALKEDDPRKLENLSNLSLIEINEVSISGHSLLLKAAYYEAKKVIDSLISNPDFDLNRKNKHGHNDVEELRLLGKDELADYIEEKTMLTISKRIKFKERSDRRSAVYPDGEPIIASVRIEPGTFMMGNSKEQVSTTITKPFTIMSVDTTQRMWAGVVQLLNTHFPTQFNSLKQDPSKYKNLDNPVETISHEQVTQAWLVGLNLLSNLKEKSVQQQLIELFPGHFLGKRYRLPTEAEWEYVSRLAGLATGDSTFGPANKHYNESAWFNRNSDNKTHSVGLKKPIMINGHPLYDIHGNVWKWMQDSGDVKIMRTWGIVDPLNPMVTGYVSRGGSIFDDAQRLSFGKDRRIQYSGGSESTGFRLVGDIP